MKTSLILLVGLANEVITLAVHLTSQTGDDALTSDEAYVIQPLVKGAKQTLERAVKAGLASWKKEGE